MLYIILDMGEYDYAWEYVILSRTTLTTQDQLLNIFETCAAGYIRRSSTSYQLSGYNTTSSSEP